MQYKEKERLTEKKWSESEKENKRKKNYFDIRDWTSDLLTYKPLLQP